MNEENGRVFNNLERKKNCGRLRIELKRATDKAKSICDEIMEFQRTGHND
jgi:hypothetical protein